MAVDCHNLRFPITGESYPGGRRQSWGTDLSADVVNSSAAFQGCVYSSAGSFEH